MAQFHEAKIGKDGTRIWLEGARLQDNGFVFGKLVSREWTKGKLVLKITTAKEFEKLERKDRGRVSGTSIRPVIDITGEIVRETFNAERVNVSYARGLIVITA